MYVCIYLFVFAFHFVYMYVFVLLFRSRFWGSLVSSLHFFDFESFSCGHCLFVFWISAQVSAWVLFATATAHHEALFCLPIYEACLIASSGIMGYVVLHEAVGPAYEVVHEAVGYWLSVTILLSGCYLLVGWPFEWDPNREISQLSCHLRRDQGKKPPPAAEGGKKRPTEASPLVQP